MKTVTIRQLSCNMEMAFDAALKLIDSEYDTLGPFYISVKLDYVELEQKGFDRDDNRRYVYYFKVEESP